MKTYIQCVLFLLLLVATVYRVVLASTFYECELLAVVLEVQAGSKEVSESLSLRINITKTIDSKQYEIGCGFESGERNIFVVANSPDALASISVGEVLVVRYTYYSGMGENGLVQSESWKLLSILSYTNSVDVNRE